MHKTIMGLMHAYTYAGNEQAIEIIDHLADWYLRWTEAMQSVNPHAVYSGEEAGMLEVWVSLYEITKNEKYMTLARRYWNPGLFGNLAAGKDPLSNCHANASIPFIHGAAKLYEVTGDENGETWLSVSGSLQLPTVECTAPADRMQANSGSLLICRDISSARQIRNSAQFIIW